MGLFNRGAETRAELEAMRRELDAVRARLDESDEAKARLSVEVGRLGGENQRLLSQVGEFEDHVSTVQDQIVTVASSMDHAISKAASVEAVESLRSDLGRLRDLASRVDEVERSALDTSAVDGLRSDLAGISGSIESIAGSVAVHEQQLADIALVATDAARRTDGFAAAVTELASSVGEVGTRFDDLGRRLDEVAATAERSSTDRDEADRRDEAARRDQAELRSDVGRLAEKLSGLDSRIDQVGLELTNQLTELSDDLESRGDPQADRAALVEELERLTDQRVTERLGDVSQGQERLAGEQARYAIEFRRDLAELADRLRRPPSR